MDFDTIEEAASPEVPMNDNFDAINWTAVYGKNHSTTSGTTWGYRGGRWSGFSITAGTLTLTNNSANYLVVLKSTGVLSTSTATTNWNNTALYKRVYKVTMAGGVVTDVEDHRAGEFGVHGAPSFSTSYSTTATAAGTTTLTADSSDDQFFTGTTTQNCDLPVTSTLYLGWKRRIVNNSTGAVTIRSSGGNTVLVLAAGTSAIVTCIAITGTTAASWSYAYDGQIIASGKSLTISESMTQTVTDGSTVAFGAGGTVLYNGGALGTPSSGNGSNITNVNAATLGGATFSAPGAIGGGTPGSIAGTTGSFTGKVGAGNTTGSAVALFAYQNGSTGVTGDAAFVVRQDGTDPIARFTRSGGTLVWLVNAAGADLTGTFGVSGTASFTGTTINMTTSGTTLTVGTGADNGTVSAGVFTDRTKFFEGDALAQLLAITGVNGQLDHDTLPEFARAQVKRDVMDWIGVNNKGVVTFTKQKVGEETAVERDIGASLSMVLVALKQIEQRLTAANI